MGDQVDDCAILDSQHPLQRLGKLPWRKKSHHPIVDSVVLSSFVAAYTTHFAAYSKEKTNVTQLVPGKVWKLVYNQFVRKHPGSKFVGKMLKDHLRETLKELKTSTSNELGSDRTVLQPDNVLTRLRNTDSHTTHNILWLYQSMLDHALSIGANLPTTTSQPSSLSMAPSEVQDAPPRLQPSSQRVGIHSPSPSSAQRLPSKAELLAAQSRSMRSIARSMEARTKGKEALLSLKMDIEIEKKKAAKIANLECAKELGAIIDFEFKSKVRSILGLDSEGPTIGT